MSLAIEGSEVVLRESDRFEIASSSLLGDAVVRITPTEGESPPLASGARVEGVPPLVTRMSESLDSAVDAVSDAAAAKAQQALEALAESIEAMQVPEPEAPEPPP